MIHVHFEAVTTDKTDALSAAIRAAQAAGGGTVVVPAGVHHVRPFELFSNVTLHLEPGSVLKASDRLDHYPHEQGSASVESTRVGLITARNAANVAITGRGTIDGSGIAFVDPSRPHTGRDLDRSFTRQKERYLDPAKIVDGPFAHSGQRPGNMVRFIDCQNVRLDGVTICNSPTWTVQCRNCDNVSVTGVHIHSRGSDCKVPNDDGIDLKDCTNVRIVGCNIDTGDDCVAIFGGHSIVVTGCTLRAKSAAIRVGYRGSDIRNCVFSDLVLDDCHRGLLVCVRGRQTIENLLFSNIVMTTRLYTGHWWGKAEPIHVSAMPLADDEPTLGRIRNVRFTNILATGENGIILHGHPQSVLEDLSLENVHLRIRNGPLQADYGGNVDLRGTNDKSTGLFARDIPALYARHVNGLRLRECDLEMGDELPAWFTHALECEDFHGLDVRGLTAIVARPSLPAVMLRRGRVARLVDGRANSADLVAREQVDEAMLG